MKKMSPLKLSLVPLLMFGFGFALVPLYDIFCEVTGINGKYYGVANSQTINSDSKLTGQIVPLRFLADADSRDVWHFTPEKTLLNIQAGKMITTYYEITNDSDVEVTVQAVPSISPGEWAEYLVKIECFCFNQQKIPARSTVRLPLQVTLSSKAPEEVNHLSLSYRIYQSESLGGTF
jgi:cytochrome c oxidase assembly protein subunit 11